MGLNDYLHQALDDILELLKNPPDNLPSVTAGCTTKQAVREVAEALKQTITTPLSIPPEKIGTPISTQSTLTKKVSWKVPLANAIPLYKQSQKGDASDIQSTKIPTQPVLKSAAPPRVPLTRVGTPRLGQKKNYTPFRRLATNYIQCMATSTDTNARRPYHLYRPLDYIHHIFNEDTGKKESIDSLRQGKYKDIWETALSREWGRLAMGTLDNPAGTDTIEFI